MRLTFTLLTSSLLLLACKPADGGGDTGGSTTSGGDESLGMGVTSASESDPTVPTVPPTTDGPGTASSITITTVPSTDATTDPTVPTITNFTEGSFTDTDPTITDPTATDTAFTTTTFGSTTTFTTDATSDPGCADPANQPQDAACTDESGCGCASGRCFLIPILGGFCGECLVDADCPDGGCTVPNPVQGLGAVCNKGEPGAGCMTDAVCNDPVFNECTPILDVPGIITVATCSECSAHADCAQAEPNCTPAPDFSTFSGVHECKPDKSVPNNQGCSLVDDVMGDPSGNKVCQSGFCGEANVMGLLKVGICGECNANADCPMGQTCTDPFVDLQLNQLVGSTCQ